MNTLLYLICFIPPMLLATYAQGLVKSRYAMASKIPARIQTRSGEGTITGAEAARIILDSVGLQRIPIHKINQGALTDYYDPKNKQICLSADIYDGNSLADVGIAAHETGHAMQDAENYVFLGLMQKAFPIARIGSSSAFYILAAGLAANIAGLIWLGVGLFACTALYQIIDLPVEYNASHRAKQHLAKLGLVSEKDMYYVRKVLYAAALTYVAAMLSAFLQFVYFMLRALAASNRNRS